MRKSASNTVEKREMLGFGTIYKITETLTVKFNGSYVCTSLTDTVVNIAN